MGRGQLCLPLCSGIRKGEKEGVPSLIKGSNPLFSGMASGRGGREGNALSFLLGRRTNPIGRGEREERKSPFRLLFQVCSSGASGVSPFLLFFLPVAPEGQKDEGHSFNSRTERKGGGYLPFCGAGKKEEDQCFFLYHQGLKGKVVPFFFFVFWAGGGRKKHACLFFFFSCSPSRNG